MRNYLLQTLLCLLFSIPLSAQIPPVVFVITDPITPVQGQPFDAVVGIVGVNMGTNNYTVMASCPSGCGMGSCNIIFDVPPVPNGDFCTIGLTAPNSTGVFSVEVFVTGPGCDPFCVTSNNFTVVLPVELISFTGQKTDRGIQLDWQTETETNNSHFNLLHSADGKQFELLRQINGAGTTDQKTSYSFLHSSPAFGTNYYQLQQVDFDGETDLSEVINVRFGENAANPVTISPNPASHFIDITTSTKVDQFRLIDLTGKVVEEGEIQEGTSLNLPLPDHLSSGILMVQLQFADGTTQTKRVVIVK